MTLSCAIFYPIRTRETKSPLAFKVFAPLPGAVGEMNTGIQLLRKSIIRLSHYPARDHRRKAGIRQPDL